MIRRGNESLVKSLPQDFFWGPSMPIESDNLERLVVDVIVNPFAQKCLIDSPHLATVKYFLNNVVIGCGPPLNLGHHAPGLLTRLAGAIFRRERESVSIESKASSINYLNFGRAYLTEWYPGNNRYTWTDGKGGVVKGNAVIQKGGLSSGYTLKRDGHLPHIQVNNPLGLFGLSDAYKDMRKSNELIQNGLRVALPLGIIVLNPNVLAKHCERTLRPIKGENSVAAKQREQLRKAYAQAISLVNQNDDVPGIYVRLCSGLHRVHPVMQRYGGIKMIKACVDGKFPIDVLPHPTGLVKIVIHTGIDPRDSLSFIVDVPDVNPQSQERNMELMRCFENILVAKERGTHEKDITFTGMMLDFE